MIRADLYRRYADMIDMCNGTKLEPYQCVKINDWIVTGTPGFNSDSNSYIFAVAIVEDRPVFVGDVLYDGLESVRIIQVENNVDILCRARVDFYLSVDELKELTWTKPAPKKWEPRGGTWWISILGKVGIGDSGEKARNFGVERETKEQAEKAAIEMRKFNRLLAYRDEFAPGFEYINGGENWFVFLANGKTWEAGLESHCFNPTTVYMPEIVARDLARKITVGEVVL